MSLTATVLQIGKTEDSFSILVSFKDQGGNEVSRQTIRFGHGATRAQVESKIQEVGNVLNSLSSSVSAVEAIRNVTVQITIPPVSPSAAKPLAAEISEGAP